MGARVGYSAANGLVVTLLCLVGGMTAILKIVPLEATLGILIWIALVIVAQAFSDTKKNHAIAVVLGLVPPLAAWVLHIIESALHAAGTTLYDAVNRFGDELYIPGIISLYQGFLLISILLAAIMSYILDRKFLQAAWWSFFAAALSALGLIHAYQLTPTGIEGSFGWMAAPWFVAAYGSLGVILLGLEYFPRPRSSPSRV
jgi:AGZA family xanthine/uracil permease-like MFS transporter